MAFWNIFGTKAAEEAFSVAGKGVDFIDSVFYTKQEKTEDEKEIGTKVDDVMKVNSAAAEYIRSKRRALFATMILVPYISGWIAAFPIMVLVKSAELISTLMLWLKLMSPLAAAAMIPYFTYFGAQMVVKGVGEVKTKALLERVLLRNHKNNKDE